MLESLITSKTRTKLLMRLFLNPETRGYLRGLAEEFNESTNAVRIELNRLQEAGMLQVANDGNKKIYSVNTKHPLYPDINNILRKITGIDDVINRIVNRLGGLDNVYLTGEMANGGESAVIDLVLVGSEIDQKYLLELVRKAEDFTSRKIRTLIIKPETFDSWSQSWNQKLLLLWSSSQKD